MAVLRLFSPFFYFFKLLLYPQHSGSCIHQPNKSEFLLLSVYTLHHNSCQKNSLSLYYHWWWRIFFSWWWFYSQIFTYKCSRIFLRAFFPNYTITGVKSICTFLKSFFFLLPYKSYWKLADCHLWWFQVNTDSKITTPGQRNTSAHQKYKSCKGYRSWY